MRRTAVLVLAVGLIVGMLMTPAAAAVDTLDGPGSHWISDPDGDGGVEFFSPVAGTSGAARINDAGATIRLRTTGLVPGHTYTMWVVYFVNSAKCTPPGCGPDDVMNAEVGGGVVFGDGKVAGGNGAATFAARMRTGDGGDVLGSPPPPFASGPYAADPANEFHLVIRSHGPKGDVAAQIHEFNGGCEDEVGPPPGSDAFPPVPSRLGECGDVQVHFFD